MSEEWAMVGDEGGVVRVVRKKRLRDLHLTELKRVSLVDRGDNPLADVAFFKHGTAGGVKCPSCGATGAHGASYCATCGAPMVTKGGNMQTIAKRDAEAAIVAAGRELRKLHPDMTEAQAITKAVELDPALSAAYRSAVPTPAPVTKAAPMAGQAFADQLESMAADYTKRTGVGPGDAHDAVIKSPEGQELVRKYRAATR